MESDPQLSAGFCAWLNEASQTDINEFGSGATVQLLSVRKAPQTTVDRYMIILSDGIHWVQVLLSTQLSDLITYGEIVRNAVVIVDELGCNIAQDKKTFVVHDLHVVCTPGNKIGNPTGISPWNAAPGSATVETPDASMSMSVDVSPQPSTSPSGPTAAGQDRPIYPIESLNPFLNHWTIRARVIQKSTINHWSNQRTQGKTFSVTFVDETGEIQATAFNDAADDFYDKLEPNKAYYVSRARVDLANKEYSKAQNDYEMVMGRNTVIEECVDSANLPMIKYSFIPLRSLETLQKDAICDVVGIVKEVGPLDDTNQRTSKKRDIVIVDKSLYSVRVTIWGKQAEIFSANDLPVVAFKGVKVGDFRGRNLSVLSSSYITISPDIKEAHLLRGWYDAVGADQHFQSFSNATSSSFGSLQLRDVGELQLGMPGKPGSFSVRATVMRISDDSVAYLACPAQGCNKKVSKTGEETWWCGKCEKTCTDPKHRFTLYMTVADRSASTWLQGFNDVGLQVFGKTADEVMAIKKRDQGAFKAFVARSAGKTFEFKCSAKYETYNGKSRLKYSVSKISPVDYYKEAKHLRDLIKGLS